MNEKLFSLIILESIGLKSKISMGRNKFFDLFFEPHTQDLTWEDIYLNFKDKSKCYYWDNYNLNIVPDETLSRAVAENHATIKIDFNDTLQ